uniref:hypothetical protein n=1 Tax=Streptomyces kanamyceticus TaxID=1967 RepID=UPI000AD37385
QQGAAARVDEAGLGVRGHGVGAAGREARGEAESVVVRARVQGAAEVGDAGAQAAQARAAAGQPGQRGAKTGAKKGSEEGVRRREPRRGAKKGE